ncbi:MAG TPA: CPCC family cysteine-rich protein [Phycisphaerales bacterium]
MKAHGLDLEHGASPTRFVGEPLVWLFHADGVKGVFPSGVWSDLDAAESWIQSNSATGILSAYVMNESAAASNRRLGLLKSGKPHKREDLFTTAVDHRHYQQGQALIQSPSAHGISSTRSSQEVPNRPSATKYQCLCCSEYSLDSVEKYDICRKCGWEDCPESNNAPDQGISPNYVSLTAARSIVERFGAAAASQVNRAGGLTLLDLESMSTKQIADLKSLDA